MIKTIKSIIPMMLIVLAAGCKKEKLATHDLPYRAQEFLKEFYPGKAVLNVAYRDYSPPPTPIGAYQSVSFQINGNNPPVVTSSSTGFNYFQWSNQNNYRISGIYMVTLDGGLHLEFNSEGYFIRKY